MKSLREIGSDIRRRRKAKRLTQGQLAARAGVTQVALSRIEYGRLRHVEYSTLAEIDRALRSYEKPFRAWLIRSYRGEGIYLARERGRARHAAAQEWGVRYNDLTCRRAPEHDPPCS